MARIAVKPKVITVEQYVQGRRSEREQAHLERIKKIALLREKMDKIARRPR